MYLISSTEHVDGVEVKVNIKCNYMCCISNGEGERGRRYIKIHILRFKMSARLHEQAKCIPQSERTCNYHS